MSYRVYQIFAAHRQTERAKRAILTVEWYRAGCWLGNQITTPCHHPSNGTAEECASRCSYGVIAIVVCVLTCPDLLHRFEKHVGELWEIDECDVVVVVALEVRLEFERHKKVRSNSYPMILASTGSVGGFLCALCLQVYRQTKAIPRFAVDGRTQSIDGQITAKCRFVDCSTYRRV